MRAWPLGLALGLAAQTASADQPTRELLVDRPNTIAELEGGILALPSAPVSASNRGGATPIGTVGNGDATLLAALHLLYRPNRTWAFGAIGSITPLPTGDPNYGGASGLARTHTRSYMFLGGEARYFALALAWFDAWIGARLGGLIIADRFTTNAGVDVPPLLGVKYVTVSTEGFAVGVQAGADYMLTDQIVLGLKLGTDRWFLPSQKPFSQESSCDAVGDCPTLTGSVQAVEFGLTLGYQLAL